MSAGKELTALVDEVFRLSDALTAAGDRLVAGEHLTAARGLTLGAVAHGPLSVAGIARRRGMRRQSAAESVAALERAGLVTRQPDPDDARAPEEETARVSSAEELADTVEVLRRIRRALEG